MSPDVPTIHAPQLGEPGEHCSDCGSTLAADQRYCLACGARRADARLPFMEVLGAGGAAPGPVSPMYATAPSAGPPLPASSHAARQRANLTAVGSVACLLAALGIGVLLGKDNSSSAKAQAPQVITVGGAGVPAAAAAGAAAGTAGSAAAAKKSASKSSSSSTKKSSSTAGSSKSTAKPSAATQQLNNTSGSDYVKKSAKLPKVVGTGGKPPPKDNKKAGGGTGSVTIG